NPGGAAGDSHPGRVRVRAPALPGKLAFVRAVSHPNDAAGPRRHRANYLTIKELGLLDTRVAMMMPFWASGYATFLLRQAFRQIPQDFEDAALIDGCSGPRFLWSVLIPLAKPTIIAFSLISIVTHWQD